MKGNMILGSAGLEVQEGHVSQLPIRPIVIQIQSALWQDWTRSWPRLGKLCCEA